ncbi:MAG: hypothetical protein OD814_000201 [Candidatus Alkanophagales archaeon MCA70_species_1]|nr:hypothetical protein [Candidatus Alkanophaga volatiphilum]
MFSVESVKEFVEKFLEYVGYELKPSETVGFVRPDVRATRSDEEKQKTYELVAVVKPGLESGKEQVLEGFRDLSAMKAFLGGGTSEHVVDYAMILPPTSERLMIAFLIDEEEWYFPIKEQGFMIWLVNPERETVNCIIGWPSDEKFKYYFEHPDVSAFDALIGRKATEKLLEEEGF